MAFTFIGLHKEHTGMVVTSLRVDQTDSNLEETEVSWRQSSQSDDHVCCWRSFLRERNTNVTPPRTFIKHLESSWCVKSCILSTAEKGMMNVKHKDATNVLWWSFGLIPEPLRMNGTLSLHFRWSGYNQCDRKYTLYTYNVVVGWYLGCLWMHFLLRQLRSSVHQHTL